MWRCGVVVVWWRGVVVFWRSGGVDCCVVWCGVMWCGAVWRVYVVHVACVFSCVGAGVGVCGM